MVGFGSVLQCSFLSSANRAAGALPLLPANGGGDATDPLVDATSQLPVIDSGVTAAPWAAACAPLLRA